MPIHGCTLGCNGCTALRMQKPPQGHSDACRRGISSFSRHAQTRRRVERSEESRDAKLARYVEHRDARTRTARRRITPSGSTCKTQRADGAHHERVKFHGHEARVTHLAHFTRQVAPEVSQDRTRGRRGHGRGTAIGTHVDEASKQ